MAKVKPKVKPEPKPETVQPPILALTIEILKEQCQVDDATFAGVVRKNRWAEGKRMKTQEFEQKVRTFLSQTAKGGGLKGDIK